LLTIILGGSEESIGQPRYFWEGYRIVGDGNSVPNSFKIGKRPAKQLRRLENLLQNNCGGLPILKLFGTALPPPTTWQPPPKYLGFPIKLAWVNTTPGTPPYTTHCCCTTHGGVPGVVCIGVWGGSLGFPIKLAWVNTIHLYTTIHYSYTPIHYKTLSCDRIPCALQLYTTSSGRKRSA
jgi:hypothetical protein